MDSLSGGCVCPLFYMDGMACMPNQLADDNGCHLLYRWYVSHVPGKYSLSLGTSWNGQENPA